MPSESWTGELALGVPEMDDTHREFVALLDALAAAADDQFLRLLDRFIAHTEAHFEQERHWMRDVRFPALHCHEAEHDGVLEIMREVREHVARGDVHVGRVLVRELPEWLQAHVQTMDGSLAYFIRTLGYRPERVEVAAAA
jgi:hemerythrin-like metal-binding protein